MNETIAKKMKIYRIINRVSQEKMAEDLYISRSKISSWETNRRDMSITDAILISDYFDASMDNLFNEKALTTDEFCQIAKRYFENDKIKLSEKNEVLKKLYQYRTNAEVKELFESK